MNRCQICKKPEASSARGTSCPLLCSKCQESYDPHQPKVDPLLTPIFWVLGGPGCGKGTQCEIIAKYYHFTHLSTGDLLRAEVATTGSERAKLIADITKQGDLVPTQIVLELVKKAMLENVGGGVGFLVDGYPRKASQGEVFERVIAPVTAILYFSATRGTLYRRLMHRAQTSGRLDDNEDTIMRRLHTFFENKDSIIEMHADKVEKIDAEGTPEEIARTVFRILDPILEKCKRLAEERREAAEVAAAVVAATSR